MVVRGVVERPKTIADALYRVVKRPKTITDALCHVIKIPDAIACDVTRRWSNSFSCYNCFQREPYDSTYDPQIGLFVSPDTIVPDAGNVFDYNRYMYVRGRVMNATDPSGHCASKHHNKQDGTYERDGDEACWATVDNILRAWKDNPEYLNARWVSPEFFLQWIAPYAANNYDFMQNEYSMNSSYISEQARNHPRQLTEWEKQQLADPQCGGQAACQALVNCDSNCLVTLGIDAVGVTASAVVVIVPIACGPAILACEAGAVATVTGAATYVGWGATSFGTLWTIAQGGTSNYAEAGVSVAGSYVTRNNPEANLVVNVVQMSWDTYVTITHQQAPTEQDTGSK